MRRDCNTYHVDAKMMLLRNLREVPKLVDDNIKISERYIAIDREEKHCEFLLETFHQKCVWANSIFKLLINDIEKRIFETGNMLKTVENTRDLSLLYKFKIPYFEL